MVETMKRIFGDRLIHAPIHDRERITLEDAMDKILIKVEYCRNPLHTQENQDQAEEVHDASSSDSSDDEETRKLRKQKQKKPAIIPELEELGVYTTSIKPIKDDFLSQADRAPKMVTNISESALSKLMKTRLPDIINHTSQYAMRVYPKGLRVMSFVACQDPLDVLNGDHHRLTDAISILCRSGTLVHRSWPSTSR